MKCFLSSHSLWIMFILRKIVNASDSERITPPIKYYLILCVCYFSGEKKNTVTYFEDFYILSYLVLLCFTLLHFSGTAFLFFFFFFLRNWGFMANHEWSKSVGTSISNRICSLCVSLSHFGNFHDTSNFFLLLLRLLWWSGISGVTDLTVLGCHKSY